MLNLQHYYSYRLSTFKGWIMSNMSKRTAYGIFAIAITIEVIGDLMLEASDAYTHLALGIAAIAVILFSFFLFSKVLHVINLAIAYATWSVLGATVCALMGVVLFHQHMTVIGWISMIVLIIATFVCNMWGTPSEETEDDKKEEVK